MTPEQAFTLANLLPVPVWACWVLAPRSSVSRHLAKALWPWAVLAGAYGLFVALAVVADAPGPGAFWSLGGVMGIFDHPWATLAGWSHYLCFDLFAARWMVNEMPEAGYRLSPVLVLTMLYGPLGLLAFMALRPLLSPRPA